MARDAYAADMPQRRYVMTVFDSRTSRSKRLLVITGALLATLIVSTEFRADASASKRTVLTISRAMALPNVTLQPGTYTFEVLNPTSSADVVVVRGGGRAQDVRFMGLTRRVARPRSLAAGQVLSFGEAPAGEPLPILAWYPTAFSSGHQFIY
jgi:hypothetical protein